MANPRALPAGSAYLFYLEMAGEADMALDPDNLPADERAIFDRFLDGLSLMVGGREAADVEELFRMPKGDWDRMVRREGALYARACAEHVEVARRALGLQSLETLYLANQAEWRSMKLLNAAVKGSVKVSAEDSEDGIEKVVFPSLNQRLAAAKDVLSFTQKIRDQDAKLLKNRESEPDWRVDEDFAERARAAAVRKTTVLKRQAKEN